METSTSIVNIAKAIIEFQKEIKPIKKGETNPFFKSKYADLPAILEAIKEPLSKAGLSFVQFPTGVNQLSTILMHTSGEFMKSTVQMNPVKNDPQGFGSCVTYFRRYALGSILGLSTEEDDDGNKASTPEVKKGKAVANDIIPDSEPF